MSVVFGLSVHLTCYLSTCAHQTGMSRDEVNIIRSYFARSVDQYIERRRILIRASAQLRNSLGAGNSGRDRLDTGDSSNSLLDNGSEENEDDRDVTEANNTNQNRDGDNENANINTPVEGEDILLDRLRMEDEWMSTQVSLEIKYSESRALISITSFDSLDKIHRALTLNSE